MKHKDWFEKAYDPKYSRIIDSPIYFGLGKDRILMRVQMCCEDENTILPKVKRFKRFPYKRGFTGI